MHRSLAGLFAVAVAVTAAEAAAQDTPLRVGSLDGPNETVFGLIADADVDPTGDVLVLDMRMLELRRFDRNGSYIGKVGSPGRGPGEFRYPEALAVDNKGRAWVLDSGNLRISIYDWRAEGEPMRTIPLPFPAFDLCVMGEHAWIAGYSPSGVVHSLDTSGVIERSFGAAVLPAPVEGRRAEILKASLSDGSLACDQESGTLVYARRDIGSIEAFSTEGRRLWSTTVPDFAAMEVVVTEAGRISYRPPDGLSYQNRVAGLVVPPKATTVLVQIETVSLGRLEPDAADLVETRWLDIDTGQWRGQGGLGGRVAHAGAETCLLFENLPYPRVWSDMCPSPAGRPK
ncbi:MAG: 6-bladed beta-propeller [Gemmatimonadota bacterium]